MGMGHRGKTIVFLFSPLNKEMDGSLWDWFGQSRLETESMDDIKIQLAIKRLLAHIYVHSDTHFLVITHGSLHCLDIVHTPAS